MIAVDDELIITEQVNEIVVRYTTFVLYKDLIKHICLNENQKISQLFIDLTGTYEAGFGYGYDNRTIEVELINSVSNYFDKLDDSDKHGFYFYYLNRNYLKLLNEHQCDLAEFENKEELKSFGRYLAYQIYEAEETNLSANLIEMLVDDISFFSTEFDFSGGTSDYYIEDINSMIDDKLKTLKYNAM